MFKRSSLPFFVFWFCHFLLQGQSGGPVHFRFGSEPFPDNYYTARQIAPDKAEVISGRYVRFIKTEKLISTADREALAASGIDMLEYIPTAVYLVSIPEYYDLSQLEKVQPRSILAVKPIWKLARNLRERPFGEWAVSGDKVAVNIRLYEHVALMDAVELCKKNGWTILKTGTNAHFIQVFLPQDGLEAAAAQPFVQYMELLPPPPQPEDTKGRSLHRSNLLDSDAPSGKKYNGTGVSVLVRDDGQLGPHIDFAGRLTNVTDQAPELGTHGDGVAGILTGAGNLDPTKKGMAAGANLFAVDYSNDFQDATLDLFFNENVTITNSSYSDGCNTGYTLATQIVDEQLYAFPTLMHVFSAGNSNGDDCGDNTYGAGNQWGNITGGHKQGKNSIATANLLSNGDLDNTSSRGPAYDGRLKPDIAANGTNQESTAPFTSYQVFGGTSGAAPGIAGCLAQLTHAYKSLHGGQEPPAALLKTLLLNSANDLGNVGPDFKFGWGHVNAGRALGLIEFAQWIEGSVDDSQVFTRTLTIPAGVRQAKIMLYWPEAPASELAPRALINDLDLTMKASDNTVYLPWKLNPTPNTVLLNTPAIKGRDSLNNVEQVSIDSPTAGIYTIRIAGTEVPMGPQPFYIAWEFLTDSVTITYPNGGEGFVPGETQRIHWDATSTQDNFVLSYSTNDGADWQTVSTIVPTARMFDWVVPGTISGKVRIRIERGALSDVSDLPFSIAPLPQNISFDQVCPNSMTLSWTDTQDTLSYDVYVLGQKYMEVVASSPIKSATFPITNAHLEKWVSVRDASPSGLAGRRAIAVRWAGGLKNCPQPDDIALTRPSLLSSNDTIQACAPVEYAVAAHIENSGTNAISGGSINYRLDNQAIISEPLPPVAVGETLDYVFQNTITLTGNNEGTIRVWTSYPQDDYVYNDTFTYQLVYVTSPIGTYFSEGFEASSTLPDGWIIENPDAADDGLTWALRSNQVVGADGNPGRALFLNNFNYNDRGQEDYLYVRLLDLSTVQNPGLSFDVAHAAYNSSYNDGLRVEVLPDCNPEATPIVIWQKIDPALATIPNSTSQFFPDAATDWRTEYINLEQFAGQTIFVRFASINDYGNNVFVDNINLIPYDFEVPEAVFSMSEDTICRADTVIYQVTSLGSADVTYAWNFSNGASPQTATGPGPHAVRYLLAGQKVPRLIARTLFAADTAYGQLLVKPTPITNFTFQITDQTVTFTNNSQNANSYYWTFGDGDTSTLANPVHTYTGGGNFIVKLVSTNDCGTTEKVTVVMLTTAVQELNETFGIQILPNPTSGDFRVEMKGESAQSVSLSLFDVQGRLLKQMQAEVKPSITTSVLFENAALDKGVYQLNVQTENGMRTLKVVVQ